MKSEEAKYSIFYTSSPIEEKANYIMGIFLVTSGASCSYIVLSHIHVFGKYYLRSSGYECKRRVRGSGVPDLENSL